MEVSSPLLMVHVALTNRNWFREFLLATLGPFYPPRQTL